MKVSELSVHMKIKRYVRVSNAAVACGFGLPVIRFHGFNAN
jgi:hypothetical protein